MKKIDDILKNPFYQMNIWIVGVWQCTIQSFLMLLNQRHQTLRLHHRQEQRTAYTANVYDVFAERFMKR